MFNFIVERLTNMVMEFFDQIRSYVTVFILFGAWSSTHGFQHKTPLRIYSVACFFAMILLFSMSVYSQRFYTYTTISNTVANSLYWLVMLTHSVVVFESILENKAQKQLIGKFMLVDHLFQVNRNIRLPYEKEKRELLIMSLAIILTIFFMYLAIYTYLYYSNNIRSFTIQSTVSIWMIRLRLMQMTFFVWILRNRLILLNQHLEIMSSVVKTDSTEPIFPKILNLKQIYQELHDACDLINVTFGISLLAILTQSFIDITSSCYWAYLTQQEGGKLIMFTAVIIQQSGVLCISGLACSLCYQEVIPTTEATLPTL